MNNEYNLSDIINPTDWIYKAQERIFEHYLKIKPGKNLIISPFREDKNPTCGFYYTAKKVLKLHDFATEEHFSCIDVVKKLFSLSYNGAVNRITQDKHLFGIIDPVDSAPYQKEEVFWDVGNPAFLNYYNRYKVINSELLLRYKVFPAKLVYTSSYILARGTNINPLFVFIDNNENIKWYKPLSKDKAKKWGGTTNSETLFGISQLPKTGTILFITSSLKDVLVLRGLGYNALALNGESYATNDNSTSSKFLKTKLQQLKKRFKYIIFYMNNDEAGIKANLKLSRLYHLVWICNPVRKPKDISDYIAHYGVLSTHRMLKRRLSKVLNQCAHELPF